MDSDQKIQQKAAAEATKHSREINYHIGDSRYIVRIINNILEDSPESPHFVGRRNDVKRFVREVCSESTRPIHATLVVELHDSTNDIVPVACSSSSIPSHILIPDLYAMSNYGGKLSFNDTILYEQKRKKALFIGASTGSYNPALNERLKTCNKYRNNPTIKCYINNICQISHENVKRVYPDYMEFTHGSISIPDQQKYKYLINIDGNTSAWDRVPWILNSNSVLLMKKSEHRCWYYDFLIPNVHYIPFDDDTDLEAIVASDEDRSEMIRNANQFVRDYLTYDRHKLYMRYLLQAISE